MELWQFKFPHWEGYNDYVYTFVSSDRLERAGGSYAVPDRWEGDIPICNGNRGVRWYGGGAGTVQAEKSGGSVDYYQVSIDHPTTKGRPKYIAECNDIIEALGMNYAEGNAFKALWRSCAERTLGKKKVGGDAVYDAEKMVFFSNRVLTQRKEQNATAK